MKYTFYHKTFEEVEELAANRETLVTGTGHLLCSKDRRPPEGNGLRQAYEAEIAWAVEVGKLALASLEQGSELNSIFD